MDANLPWLTPADPPDSFPDPDSALDDPDGLLAIGGDLSEARLLAAYKAGIFPWYQDEQPILWWCPDPRAVLFPAELHISRSLRRTIKRDPFTVSVDVDFAAVIAACAADRRATGTWITAEMEAAYCRLHDNGHAHSVEIWQNGKLVGGVYGVTIGGMFFGESMFSRETDASKVALVQLVATCIANTVELIDCQIASAHLTTLGSRQITRREFLNHTAQLTQYRDRDLKWALQPRPVRELLR
jgi:leucyl/phenylalanyl-tRNA--protein transferase